MDPERRENILRILEESALAFHTAVDAVPEISHQSSPSPDRWCVLQIVEHVALAENGMFRMLNAAAPCEPSPGNAEREAAIFDRIASRRTRVESPDRAKPAGRFPDTRQALDQFDAARQNTIRFARETDKDLFSVVVQHPFAGPVNGYEMLLIMAAHPRRHVMQLAELASGRVTAHSAPDTALPE